MADKTVIQKSATIGADDTTIADIQAGQKAVKAPDSARVTTGGYYQPNPEVEGQQYSLTFTWVE